MSLMSMLRTTCDQKRKTNTKDASGGMTMTFTTVSSGIPCDIQPASGNVRLQYMEMQAQATHSIYMASDLNPLAGDIFDSDGRRFQFLGKRRPAPGYTQWPCIIDVEEQG